MSGKEEQSCSKPDVYEVPDDVDAHGPGYNVIEPPKGPPIGVETITFEISPDQVHIPKSPQGHVSIYFL